MIRVGMTDVGAIHVRGSTKNDRDLIREIKYLRYRNSVGVAWWTYLGDLRRDLPRSTRFSKKICFRLTAVVERLNRRGDGDDAEIEACFAEGLRPYRFQLFAIHSALAQRRLLIADATGLGKTIQTIGVMLTAFARGEIKRAILIVPPGLKHQWAEEIHRFAAPGALPGKVVVIPSGKPDHRRSLYRGAWTVLIVNKELVLRDHLEIANLVADVGLVALDEASSIRNPESKTASVLKRLFVTTRYRLALTATPLENGLHDVRSIMEWVDPRVFGSREYFDERYVVWKTIKFKVYSKKWKKKVRVVKREPASYRHLDEVRAKLRPAYIRRRVSDVGLELPELVVCWERLDLPARQRRVYDAVRDKVEVLCQNLRGAALEAPLQALRQACNSTALVERGDGSKPVQIKVDRIAEWLGGELSDEVVLIFTDYERFASLLARDLAEFRPVLYTGEETKRRRQRAVDAIRLGDRRILIGTSALERGHNLQVASIVLNADLPYNPGRIKQRIGRSRRIGSEHQTVRMINMVANDTVEDKLIAQILYRKRKVFEGIFGDDELTESDPLEEIDGRNLRGML